MFTGHSCMSMTHNYDALKTQLLYTGVQERVPERNFVPFVRKQMSPFSLFVLELCIDCAIVGLICLRFV